MSRFNFVFIGSFFLLISILSFLNIIYSYYFNLYLNLDTYVYTLIISLCISILLFIRKKVYYKNNIFDKILVVISGYIFIPLVISIPYFLSIYNLTFIDCYFEAISGFTSTGFTIFDNIKNIDESLVLWRSSSQWIGGLYFLFSLIILIDIFDNNLKDSFTEFSSFNISETLNQSLKVLILYTFLTFLIFILLKFVNIRNLDAFNLSLTLISSGGFLSTNSLDQILNNDLKKIITSITMLFSFFSIFLFYNIVLNRSKKLNVFYEDFYLLIYLLFLIIIFFIFFNEQNNFPSLLLSIATTISNIGFYLNDSNENMLFVYLILVIIGGSFFSTSSGLRFIKLLALVKFSINDLLSHAKPKHVLLSKSILFFKIVEKKDLNKYFLSLIIFIISMFMLTLLLTITNINYSEAFRISILTLMNTVNSSLFGLNDYNFNDINIFTKNILMFFMIIGRVELLTVLILMKKFLSK